MSELPVLVFHRGNQTYLKRVLDQAQKWNSQVWLIGNAENRGFAKNWVDADSLNSELFDEFLKVYVHMSTRPYAIEMFCFESHFKYFALAEKMGWNRFITMDSDVMIFKTFSDEDFKNVDAAYGWTEDSAQLSYACDPFVAYWTLDSMKEFLEFMIETYHCNSEVLKNKWKYHQENRRNGGVCDMTLLALWTNQTKRSIFNLAKESNSSTYDLKIDMADNSVENEYKYSKAKRLKVVKFEKGIPYLLTKDNRVIRANVLHCNGHCKKCIPLIQRNSNCGIAYAMINWITWIKIKIKHLLRRIKKFVKIPKD